jgi:hypothetical protein
MKFGLPSLVLLALAACAFTGCSSYINSPAAQAGIKDSQKAFSDPLIARAYHAQPTMHFPARLGLAPQDDESRQQLRVMDALGKLDRFKSLPDVTGFVTVNSLVMSSGYDGDESKRKPVWNRADLMLREAAAKLHADAVLLVKIDTHVTDGKLFAPLSTLTLGMFPNNRAEIIATAFGALVDTRTGYIYGVLEKSAGRTNLSISWDPDSRTRAVQKTEQAAMEKLLAEFPDFWRGIVQAHRK